MKNISGLQMLAIDWAIRCFGADHVYNAPVRSLRLAEEAVELAQAYGVPKEKMLDLIEIVYQRPRGNPDQEMGGVAMTAAVMAGAIFQQPLEDFLKQELRRVLNKPADHFTQRNKEKLDLGLKA